jgi:hypothetical protein
VEADAGCAGAIALSTAAGVDVAGEAVACCCGRGGVELARSMFFSPLTMDAPLGALVSPDPDALAAAMTLAR